MVEAMVHEVYRLGDPSSTDTVVVLKAQDQERYLPIWINFPQAMAIMRRLRGLQDQRPNTYLLMSQLVEGLGGRVDSIHVTSLESTIYYATVRLMANNAKQEVDCRPSDALALAMEVGAPIFLDADVLAQHGCDDATSFHHERMGTLQSLEPPPAGLRPSELPNTE